MYASILAGCPYRFFLAVTYAISPSHSTYMWWLPLQHSLQFTKYQDGILMELEDECMSTKDPGLRAGCNNWSEFDMPPFESFHLFQEMLHYVIWRLSLLWHLSAKKNICWNWPAKGVDIRHCFRIGSPEWILAYVEECSQEKSVREWEKQDMQGKICDLRWNLDLAHKWFLLCISGSEGHILPWDKGIEISYHCSNQSLAMDSLEGQT